ncbi:MAG: GNAT family N-acetyltransferase [Bdellovibrionales bacterium]
MNLNDLEISVIPCYKMQTEILNFYMNCSRGVKLEESDQFVIAFQKGMIVGLVRLCLESDTYVLRTMQIHPHLQRLGIGTQLLKRFESLLNERGIKEIYCIPFEHLDSFYSKIGFTKIETYEAPEFLQERLLVFQRTRPTETFIIMKKKNLNLSTDQVLQ